MKQGMILVPALLLTLLGGCESMPMHMNEDELLELAENYGTETAAVSTMTTPAPALHPPHRDDRHNRSHYHYSPP